MSIRHACMVRFVGISLVHSRCGERHLVLTPASHDQCSEADGSAYNDECCIEHERQDSIV